MKNFLKGILCLSALCVISTTSIRAETTIDEGEFDFQKLETMIALSFANNPTLAASRAEVQAVEESLPQAFSGWLPTLAGEADIRTTDLTGSNFGTASGSTAKGYGLNFSQPVFRGGSTVAATSAAEDIIKGQYRVLDSQIQSTIVDTATAYMDVLQNKALVDLSVKNMEVIGREYESTNERFRVGELTRTDVSQAQARLSRAEADLIRAKGDLSDSVAIFEQVIGITPQELGAPEVEFAFPPTLEEAIDLADRNHPDIIAAKFFHRASESDVDQVFGELLPQLGLSGSWRREKDPQPGLIEETTTKSVGLTATVPIYSAGAVRSRVREAKHTANQRYMQILSAQRQVRQEVIRNWENLAVARAEIVSRQAQVEASTVAQEGVREEASVGTRTILDVLDADQELLEAQVSLVTARRNETVAMFNLAQTMGMLIPEVMGLQRILELRSFK